MGKVKQDMAKGKKDTTKAPAPTRAKEPGTALAQPRMSADERNEMIRNLRALGFAALSQSDSTTRLEETGIVEKESLLDVPFIILAVDIRPGDFGGDYVSVTAMNEANDVFVFNDGGTGIKSQLEGMSPPVLIPGGLRASHYEYTDPNTGKKAPATTYYLSGRPPKNRNANGAQASARA